MFGVPPLLSLTARKKKIEYFFPMIPKEARILEIGSGSDWAGSHLRKNGWENYTSLDIASPADIIGDIKNYRNYGIEEESFDVIIAFEVIEHVDCAKECYDILKSGGKLMLTSPVPHMDWIMKIFELLSLNQQRTSPHCNLIYFKDFPYFEENITRNVGFLSQWGGVYKEVVLRIDL